MWCRFCLDFRIVSQHLILCCIIVHNITCMFCLLLFLINTSVSDYCYGWEKLHFIIQTRKFCLKDVMLLLVICVWSRMLAEFHHLFFFSDVPQIKLWEILFVGEIFVSVVAVGLLGMFLIWREIFFFQHMSLLAMSVCVQMIQKTRQHAFVTQDMASFLCLVCEIFLAPKLRMQQDSLSLYQRLQNIRVLCAGDISMIPRWGIEYLNTVWICVPHSDECPCGTGPQTPNHILQSCPTFDDLRRQTWPSPVEPHRKLWGPVETLQQTVDFALLTGLKI